MVRLLHIPTPIGLDPVVVLAVYAPKPERNAVNITKVGIGILVTVVIILVPKALVRVSQTRIVVDYLSNVLPEPVMVGDGPEHAHIEWVGGQEDAQLSDTVEMSECQPQALDVNVWQSRQNLIKDF